MSGTIEGQRNHIGLTVAREIKRMCEHVGDNRIYDEFMEALPTLGTMEQPTTAVATVWVNPEGGVCGAVYEFSHPAGTVHNIHGDDGEYIPDGPLPPDAVPGPWRLVVYVFPVTPPSDIAVSGTPTPAEWWDIRAACADARVFR